MPTKPTTTRAPWVLVSVSWACEECKLVFTARGWREHLEQAHGITATTGKRTPLRAQEGDAVANFSDRWDIETITATHRRVYMRRPVTHTVAR